MTNGTGRRSEVPDERGLLPGYLAVHAWRQGPEHCRGYRVAEGPASDCWWPSLDF